MSDLLDQKYIMMLGGHLRNFKRITQTTYKFSCNVCGDSKKNKAKARGYIYPEKGKYKFKCHNCSAFMSFPKYLEYSNISLYNEYVFEQLRENMTPMEEYKEDIGKFAAPRFTNFGQLKALKKISSLPETHAARKYVLNRKIPSNYHYKLFYCPKFFAWVNTIIPDKFEEKVLPYDEPRLIIPFIDQNKYLFGFQGRSFKKDSTLRYITIMLDPEKQKIFGLDTVDLSGKVYFLEGPIDSMFIPNSLALAGADGFQNIIDQNRDVMIYDNEPRNKEIIKKIFTSIQNGYNVVIWPNSLNYKDINQMIEGGMTVPEIMNIIDTHTFNGLAAELELNKWKKVSL